MFAGLITAVIGLTVNSRPVAAAGGILFLMGLLVFAAMAVSVLRTPRRRRFPVSGLHLVAALAWLALVAMLQIPMLAAGDTAGLRDLWVVGGAVGFVLQAVLGAWSFLLPAAPPSIADLRRRELLASEMGGRV
jgi:hypothetical protein